MASRTSWGSPLTRQMFVVVGAAINMAQISMVMGFTACLLPQLRAAATAATAPTAPTAPTAATAPTAPTALPAPPHIPIDDDIASWLASLPALGLVAGNLAVSQLLDVAGRRATGLLSVALVAAGWGAVAAARGAAALAAGRLLQGLSAGMSSCLAPLLVGECASPRRRGALSVLMSLVMALGTLAVHVAGAHASWRTTAWLCAALSLLDLALVALAPESPSWLAARGRHEECARVFRWLRGPGEEEELAAMLRAVREGAAAGGAKRGEGGAGGGWRATLGDEQFYKPIVVMMHLYAMGHWAGINVLTPYAGELVAAVAGPDVDVGLVVLSLDAQRVASCALAALLVRRARRRTALFATLSLNCGALLLIAGYVAGAGEPPRGGAAAGVPLLHLLMFGVATGSLPLPYAVAGEIFPLRHKALAGALSSVFSSVNVFLSVKTYPLLVRRAGLPGAFCAYAALVLYCLAALWFLLPETKDKTLQEIEEYFRSALRPSDEKGEGRPLAARGDATTDDGNMEGALSLKEANG